MIRFRFRLGRRFCAALFIILFFIGLLFSAWNEPTVKEEWSHSDKEISMSCNNDQREASVNISTLNLYEILPMPKKGGGDKDWAKLYLDYNLSRWRDDPLQVFLVPFSHTDPGWLETAEVYYNEKSSRVITNAVLKLHQYKKMTFIWMESIYLSWWWDSANSTMRGLLNALIKEGRFEIAGGGWVMPDEANPTGYALVDQMLEGHLFLRQKLGYTPKTSFNIDPFGYSATAARIRSLAGLKHSVINRIHYKMKEFLDLNADAEFVWRQMWDDQGSDDLRVYLNPLHVYTIKSCGPMHWICAEYNFRTTDSAPAIDPLNLRGQALKLLDQLRKKSLWFKHNVVMVILGDDFYYSDPGEFDRQFENWSKLFEHFNKHSDELRVKAKFATLSEYFEAADEALEKVSPLKTLSGDFFTYNDGDESYWSGYYTTRMSWKVLGRRLEALLRVTDIFFTLSADARDNPPASRERKFHEFRDLRSAHQQLALFQHHDDITGTSKKHSAADIARRLSEGFVKAQRALVGALGSLMDLGTLQEEENETLRVTLLPKATVVGVEPVVVDVRNFSPSVTLVVLVNGLPFKRREMIRLRVNRRDVQLKTTKTTGKILRHQIDPVWVNPGKPESGLYELIFELEMEPLRIEKIFVHSATGDSSGFSSAAATIVELFTYPNLTLESDEFRVDPWTRGEGFNLSNGCLAVEFDGNDGLMRRMVKAGAKDDTANKLEARIGFWWYPSVNSGAYLFRPKGPAIDSSPPLMAMIIAGPLVTTVRVFFPMIEHVLEMVGGMRDEGNLSLPSIQTCKDSVLRQSILITNRISLKGSDTNLEPVMRFDTDIDSGADFFTDANSLAMMKRRRLAKLPIQGNFYPMPSAAFIEDRIGSGGRRRLTLLSAQPQGASSQRNGSLEMMQDRRLMKDDGRGMGEGVLDNGIATLRYDLVLEEAAGDAGTAEAAEIPLLSFAARQLRRRLNSPIEVFFSAEPRVIEAATEAATADAAAAEAGAVQVDKNWVPHKSQTTTKAPPPFPCDVDLLSLRPLPNLGTGLDEASMTLPGKEAVFILSRSSSDCRYPTTGDASTSCDATGGSALSLKRHLGEGISVRNARAASLTLLHDGEELGDDPVVELKPEALISIVAEVGTSRGKA